MKDLMSFYLKLQTSLYFFSRLKNPLKDFIYNSNIINEENKITSNINKSIENNYPICSDLITQSHLSQNYLKDNSYETDYFYLKWNKGTKKYPYDILNNINQDEILEQFYLFMKLNCYHLDFDKENDIWLCSNKEHNNIYYLEILHNKDLSFSYNCTCPFFTYHNENCKHIYMLKGLFIFLNNNYKEINIGYNFINKY
ncbi:SWIM zinc finger family protein [Arthrospira platensis SPKY2]